MALVALVEIQAPMEVEGLPRAVATQNLWSQLYRHRLPVHRASSNKLPFHHSPRGNRLIVLPFTTPLEVPTCTVFDPSIGLK